jgi:photosystem II stability/assembly factor-like uncharacterized protein
MTFPASTTNMTLRLDAASSVLGSVSPDVAASEAGSVRRWVESVASRQLNQSTAGNQPNYGAKLLNANPGLQFVSDESLTSSVALSTLVTSSAFDIAIVFRCDNVVSNNASAWLNDAVICDESGFFGLFVRLLAGAPTLYAYVWDGAAKVASATITLGKSHVVYFRKTGGSHFLSIDGGSETSVASGNIATITGNFAIGNRASVNARFNGAIGELLVFNAARSSTDRNADISYLVAKYSTSGKPAGYEWSRLLVHSGGRLDSVEDLGGGNVLSASRTPNPAKVYGSTNSGVSWSLYETVGTVDLTTIKSAGSGVAYMVDENSKVYKTANYGDTWADLGQLSSATPVSPFARCYGLLVTSAGSILVADMANTGGRIFRSTDGGSSFTNLGTIGTGGIYRLQEVGDGILCNDTSGRIFKTIDDGVTWISKGQLVASPLWAIEYCGNGICLVASESGQIFRSTDNGENWSSIITLDGGADDLAYIGSIVIYSTYTSRKQCYRSDDLGVTWYLSGVLPTLAGDTLEHVIANEGRFIGVTNAGYVVRSNQAIRQMRQCPQCLGVGVIA